MYSLEHNMYGSWYSINYSVSTIIDYKPARIAQSVRARDL